MSLEGTALACTLLDDIRRALRACAVFSPFSNRRRIHESDDLLGHKPLFIDHVVESVRYGIRDIPEFASLDGVTKMHQRHSFLLLWHYVIWLVQKDMLWDVCCDREAPKHMLQYQLAVLQSLKHVELWRICRRVSPI